MARLERKRNPTLEEMQQAYAQRRLVMETPQIPPFHRGNISALMDFLEKVASLQNRRIKAKLSGDTARVSEMRASQKKLAGSEQAQLLRTFQLTFWGRVLAGALAQGIALSLFISLIQLAITRQWSWSVLSLVTVPIIWVALMWGLAPPVLGTSSSPKRARKLARALSRRTQIASVYALVARPWLTAVAIWKMPPQLWAAYKARKAAKK
ncbi:MAG: hypothetical protein HYX72_12465 [Acidobacteria bacterium]|nr:hypothetical protein [Acidobacteriota bacterium]